MKPDRPTTNREPAVWGNIPPHAVGHRAVGGNQVFADGSARWIPLKQMYFLTVWEGRIKKTPAFMYQDPSDFDAGLLQQLPTLAAEKFW
jgi:hypothetical protein